MAAGPPGSGSDHSRVGTNSEVGTSRPRVKRQYRCAGMAGCGCDQRVIDGASTDPPLRQGTYELHDLLRGQRQRRMRKVRLQQFRGQLPRDPIGRRQSGQHTEGFDQGMSGNHRLVIEYCATLVMAVMPGAETRYDHTCINGYQRRIWFRTSRTMSDVKAGIGSSVVATSVFPRISARIGTLGGSRTICPSISRISNSCPGPQPKRARRSFGMTTRPPPSMVVRMVRRYHRDTMRALAQAHGAQ